MSRLDQLDVIDQMDAYRFCEAQPEACVYIAGWLHGGGLQGAPDVPRGWLLAERDPSSEIVGLAFLSATGILIPVLRSRDAIEGIAAIAHSNRSMIRVLVGERQQVGAIWKRLEPLGFATRLGSQPRAARGSARGLRTRGGVGSSRL